MRLIGKLVTFDPFCLKHSPKVIARNILLTVLEPQKVDKTIAQ